MAGPVTDHRAAIAERNVEAILDGAERLLQSGKHASIAAVAAEAGLSRVTVYAHFPDRRRLVEALVERAVRRASTAVDAAEPDDGPATEALARVLEASWEQLGRHEGVARAAASELSGEAMRRAHETARERIRLLVERGRREGAFRTDLGVDWLVSCFFAVIHTAGDEVRAGHLSRSAALQALSATVSDLFVRRTR